MRPLYDFRIAAVRVGRATLTVKADIRDGPFKAIPNFRCLAANATSGHVLPLKKIGKNSTRRRADLRKLLFVYIGQIF